MAGPNIGIAGVPATNSTAATKVTTNTGVGNKICTDVSVNQAVNDYDDDGWTDFNVDTTPDYSDGDHMGDASSNGAIEFTNQISVAGKSGFVTQIIMTDDDKTNGDMDILIFDSQPTIASSENAALDISEANLDKLCGRARIRLGHWSDITGHTIADVKLSDPDNGGPIRVQADGTTSLWVVLQARSTINFATAGALRMKMSIVEI